METKSHGFFVVVFRRSCKYVWCSKRALLRLAASGHRLCPCAAFLMGADPFSAAVSLISTRISLKMSFDFSSRCCALTSFFCDNLQALLDGQRWILKKVNWKWMQGLILSTSKSSLNYLYWHGMKMFLAAVSISTVLSGLHMNLQRDCELVSINRALKAVIPNNDCFFCFVSLVISCNKMLHCKRDLKLMFFLNVCNTLGCDHLCFSL